MAYDYLLTLRDEKSLIWRCKWTGTTLFFIAIRVEMIGWAADYIAPWTRQVCTCLYRKLEVPRIYIRTIEDVGFVYVTSKCRC